MLIAQILQPALCITQARGLGFKLGLGGCLTYGHAELDAAVRIAPTEMLLLETDSPYLAPMPHRGKVNQPAWVAHVAGFAAGAVLAPRRRSPWRAPEPVRVWSGVRIDRALRELRG